MCIERKLLLSSSIDVLPRISQYVSNVSNLYALHTQSPKKNHAPLFLFISFQFSTSEMYIHRKYLFAKILIHAVKQKQIAFGNLYKTWRIYLSNQNTDKFITPDIIATKEYNII